MACGPPSTEPLAPYIQQQQQLLRPKPRPLSLKQKLAAPSALQAREILVKIKLPFSRSPKSQSSIPEPKPETHKKSVLWKNMGRLGTVRMLTSYKGTTKSHNSTGTARAICKPFKIQLWHYGIPIRAAYIPWTF